MSERNPSDATSSRLWKDLMDVLERHGIEGTISSLTIVEEVDDEDTADEVAIAASAVPGLAARIGRRWRPKIKRWYEDPETGFCFESELMLNLPLCRKTR